MPKDNESLENACSRCRRSPLAFLGAAAVSASVFVSMGMMQLNLEYSPPEASAPISQYFLPPPPPPPPPPASEDAPEQPQVQFDMELNFSSEDVALNFVPVDFGLTAEKLVQAQPEIAFSMDDYDTGGLDMLQVFEQSSLTQKPERRYTPPPRIPSRLKSRLKETLRFEVIYIVTPDGRATNVHVLDCPIPELVPFIREYIGKWRFTPPMRGNQAVQAWARHPIILRPSATGATPFSL